MKKMLLCACALACLGLASCDLVGPPLEIVVEYAPVQYPEIVDLEFPVLFPLAADIGGLVAGAELASHGPTLGATIVAVQMTSNQAFYITGVRIENVRYSLLPTPDADGSPIGTSSSIEYIHPTAGVVSPITPNLGLVPEAQSAVIPLPEDAPQTFEVGLSSALRMWDHIDADRDGTVFPDDDDEELAITCSLFFEGFLENGAEFTGAFPPPLLLNIVVKHDVP